MITQQQEVKYRYERKFAVTELDRADVEAIVRLNPAAFREIYQRRWINNIYLDTWALGSYHENLVGCSHDRVKTRIRWYGDLLGEVARPVLELKIKHGMVNRKESYRLPPLAVDEQLSVEHIRERIRAAEMPASLRDDMLKLDLALVNRYSRRYFRSWDREFRLTIDSELTYYRISAAGNRFVARWVDPASIVVELKYATDADPQAERITQHFPFRLTRSSKYVNGIERFRL